METRGLSIITLGVTAATSIANVTATTASSPRGVPTSLREEYTSMGAEFTCGGGRSSGSTSGQQQQQTTRIPASFVNDNYCDCLDDGSDEPGTGACTYQVMALRRQLSGHQDKQQQREQQQLEDEGKRPWYFHCRNEGYEESFPQSFPHTFVGDGICDCCDGSDENEIVETAAGAETPIGCPNTCVDAQARHREEHEEREKVRQAGLAARDVLTKRAASRLERWKHSLERVKELSTEMKALCDSHVDSCLERLSSASSASASASTELSTESSIASSVKSGGQEEEETEKLIVSITACVEAAEAALLPYDDLVTGELDTSAECIITNTNSGESDDDDVGDYEDEDKHYDDVDYDYNDYDEDEYHDRYHQEDEEEKEGHVDDSDGTKDEEVLGEDEGSVGVEEEAAEPEHQKEEEIVTEEKVGGDKVEKEQAVAEEAEKKTEEATPTAKAAAAVDVVTKPNPPPAVPADDDAAVHKSIIKDDDNTNDGIEHEHDTDDSWAEVLAELNQREKKNKKKKKKNKKKTESNEEVTNNEVTNDEEKKEGSEEDQKEKENQKEAPAEAVVTTAEETAEHKKTEQKTSDDTKKSTASSEESSASAAAATPDSSLSAVTPDNVPIEKKEEAATEAAAPSVLRRLMNGAASLVTTTPTGGDADKGKDDDDDDHQQSPPDDDDATSEKKQQPDDENEKEETKEEEEEEDQRLADLKRRLSSLKNTKCSRWEKKAESTVKTMTACLEEDYGRDNVAAALRQECFELDHGGYVWSMCPYGEAKQGGSTSLGHWKGWGEQTYGSWGSKFDFGQMHFENGTACWNGVKRSLSVKVVCGPETSIASVEEPSMCTYAAVLYTPFVCE